MEFLIMSCDITSGIARGCNDAKAGVKTMYLGKWSKDLVYSYSGNELNSLTADFYEFETNICDYNVTIGHDDAGEIYNIDVSAEFHKVTQEKASLMNDLSDFILFAILETYNGEYIYLGLENGLNPQITETSGGAKNSFNGYSLKLEGVQEQIPPLRKTYVSIDNPCFVLLPNGVTVRYLCNTPGDTGKINGVTYTAVDQTMYDALNPTTDDYTTICTTLVTDMSATFFSTSFNQNISHFDTANVTTMRSMFEFNNSFNQDISNWDVSNVTTFQQMFRGMPSQRTVFNQDISNWDTSSAVNMLGMFEFSQFNQPLNNWNVSSVQDFERMFKDADNFNQSLNNWNTSSATKMREMFESNSVFNQDIGNWDVSNVTNMDSMFQRAADFNQDLSSWCIEQIPSEPTNFDTGAASWLLPRPNWGCLFTNAFMAFSLRDLGLGATKSIRVRRSSDNNEQDFTFLEITNGTLTTFCGAGDGFVTVWYDQTGNGRHVANSRVTEQPQIVSSGSLITENGKPALQFNGNQFMSIADFNYGLKDKLTIVSVKDSGIGTLINHYDTNLNERSWRINIDNSNRLLGLHSTDGTNFGVIRFDPNLSAQQLNFTYFDPNNITPGLKVVNYANGIQEGIQFIQNIPSGNLHDSSASIAIGAVNVDTSATDFYNGKMQEIILDASDQLTNRGDIETNINDYYNIY